MKTTISYGQAVDAVLADIGMANKVRRPGCAVRGGGDRIDARVHRSLLVDGRARKRAQSSYTRSDAAQHRAEAGRYCDGGHLTMMWLIGYPLLIAAIAIVLANLIVYPLWKAVGWIRTSKWWLRRVALSRFRMWAVL
jgi:hypothetical protein